MEKNVDFVAYEPNLDSSWIFHLAGKARTISEEYNEILEIIKKIFLFSEDFLYQRKLFMQYRLFQGMVLVMNQ